MTTFKVRSLLRDKKQICAGIRMNTSESSTKAIHADSHIIQTKREIGRYISCVVFSRISLHDYRGQNNSQNYIIALSQENYLIIILSVKFAFNLLTMHFVFLLATDLRWWDAVFSQYYHMFIINILYTSLFNYH